MPLASDTPLTDDYVARLLTRDALNVSSGTSKRSALAPKPNTRFLKNILREADGHNAALKRREDQEARDRRRGLDRQDRQRGQVHDRDNGRLTPPARDEEEFDSELARKRRRLVDGREGTRHEEPRRQRHPERHARSRSRERHQHRGYRDGDRKRAEHSMGERKAHKRRRSQSRSPRRHGKRPHERNRRVPSRDESPPPINLFGTGAELPERRSRLVNRSSPSSESDSDPLESLIGPLPAKHPPEPMPTVRGRGRGTASGSALDRHFNKNYDPSIDVDPEPDAERDDWDQALEAVRDRQKWQQIGAQRLREAGFGESDIKKWEKKKGPAADGEGDIGDVRWTKHGEDREWDRGKVANGDGISADVGWGRLKGT